MSGNADSKLESTIHLPQTVIQLFFQYAVSSNKHTKSNEPCLLSEHDHQVILEKIEARENINHDEYVEEEDYYNVDSDESDIDAN